MIHPIEVAIIQNPAGKMMTAYLTEGLALLHAVIEFSEPWQRNGLDLSKQGDRQIIWSRMREHGWRLKMREVERDV